MMMMIEQGEGEGGRGEPGGRQRGSCREACHFQGLASRVTSGCMQGDGGHGAKREGRRATPPHTAGMKLGIFCGGVYTLECNTR